MKRWNFLRSMATVMFAAAALWSCKENDGPEDPIIDPVWGIEANTFEINGEKRTVGSAVVTDDLLEGRLLFAVTPTTGLKTADAVFGEDNYISVAVDESLVGRSFVIPDDADYCSAWVLWEGDAYDSPYELSEGTVTVTDKGDGLYEVVAELFSYDGNTYAVRAEAVLPERVTVEPDTFWLNGETVAVGSAVVTVMENGYIYLVATPDRGYTSADEIFSDCSRYMYVAVSPSLIGEEFNLKTERTLFTVMAVWDNHYIYHYPESDPEEDGSEGVASGRCTVTDKGDNTYEFSFVATTVDGYTLGMCAEGTAAEASLNSNTISYSGYQGGTSTMLRGAFHYTAYEDYGMTTLYFTPSEVYTFDELMDISIYYVYVMVPSLSAGQEYTASLANNYDVTVGIMENFGDYMSYSANSGSLRVKSLGDGKFEVNMSGDFSDDYGLGMSAQAAVEFAGQTVPDTYVLEDPNEFTYNGSTRSLNSAFIEKTSSSEWVIWLSTIANAELEDAKGSSSSIKITIPSRCFTSTYTYYGFSTFRNAGETAEIKYDNSTWSTTNASATGTVGLALDGNVIELDLMNLANPTLKAHYKGAVTIK